MNAYENILLSIRPLTRVVLFLIVIPLASIDRYSIVIMLKIKRSLTLVLSIVKVAVANYNAYKLSSRNQLYRKYLLGRIAFYETKFISIKFCFVLFLLIL